MGGGLKNAEMGGGGLLPVERCLFEISGFECLSGGPHTLDVGIYAADLIPHKCSTGCPPPLAFSVTCNVITSFLRFSCNSSCL